MQNYDFARASRPAPQPRKHYRPNPASRYNGPAETPKKGINTAYMITVFTFFGFSFGIGLGLYLANTNSSVQNFTSKIFQKGEPIRGAGMQGAAGVTPGPNTPVTAGGNTTQTVHNTPNPQADVLATPEIQSKRYYLYLGLYKPNVGYRLLQNLKKYNLTAWPRQSKEQIKLYIGFYEDLGLAKEDLAKVNRISKEYFGNAAIKVYSPKGANTSS